METFMVNIALFGIWWCMAAVLAVIAVLAYELISITVEHFRIKKEQMVLKRLGELERKRPAIWEQEGL